MDVKKEAVFFNRHVCVKPCCSSDAKHQQQQQNKKRIKKRQRTSSSEQANIKTLKITDLSQVKFRN